MIKEGAVGPGLAFQASLGEEYEIVATIICGDNYFAENTESAIEQIFNMVKKYNPNMIIAGPAFNAGRYGPACGAVCKEVGNKLGIPAVTGMYAENPGTEIYRKDCYIVKTKDSAASMRASVKTMSDLIKKILSTDEIPTADKDNYFSRGKKKNVFLEKNGAERAVDMLLDKMIGRAFKTELDFPSYEKVKPAKPIADLKTAKLALVTDAGLTDKENSYRLESARASKYIELSIEGRNNLSPNDFCSVHGGFDPTYANTRPDVLVPLDIVRELQNEGKFASLHEIIYSTTGNGTSIKNSQQFGSEIASKLLETGVQGVLLTST